MQQALLITSVPELENWLSVRSERGFTSAQFYLKADRDLQLSIEEALHSRGYQTIFIFGENIRGCILTHGYALW